MIRTESGVVAKNATRRPNLRGPAIICGVFGLLCAPLLFVNNTDQATLTASFIDGGSIVVGVRDVLAGEYSYNQNNGFHTSVYGWTYNAVLIGIFALLSSVLRVDAIEHFYVYAFAAKGLSFFLSLGCIVGIHRLASRLFDSAKVAAAATVVAVCFASFVRFAYLIHPEPAGLAAALGMFLFLGRYLQDQRARDYLAAVGCSTAAVLSKQPFVFTLVPLVAGYFSAHFGRESLGAMLRNRKHWTMAAGSVGIGFLVLVVIHPFALFDFDRFYAAQKYMLGAHVSVEVPRSKIVAAWLQNIGAHWIVVAGLFVAVVYLTTKRFRGTARERLFSLLALYVVVFVGWLATTVYPAGEPGYYYPVYPFLALLSFEGAIRLLGALPKMLDQGTRSSRLALARHAVVGCMSVLVAAAAFVQTLKSVSYATNMLAMGHTDPFVVAGLLRDLDRAGRSSILYSCTVPVSKHDWKQAVNTFQVGGSIEKLTDQLDLDLVALDLQRAWTFETELKDRAEIPRMRYVYEIPNRYEIYDWEIDKGNDVQLHWKQLCNSLRRLADLPAAGGTAATGVKVFSREPIVTLAEFERGAILNAKRRPEPGENVVR